MMWKASNEDCYTHHSEFLHGFCGACHCGSKLRSSSARGNPTFRGGDIVRHGLLYGQSPSGVHVQIVNDVKGGE
jgi:hypothetical protein